MLQGTAEDGLTVYRGVPFAAPPVGDLRWRAPQPAAKWQGVRQADKFAPQCVQGGGPPGAGQPAMSEDCLYLNVWSPAKAANDRIPVLVWIYGGGFNAGATSIPTYSGEKLAKKGVVLVSIGYRVGPLGFLAHPELSAESQSHSSGNYGLLDMIAGLNGCRRISRLSAAIPATSPSSANPRAASPSACCAPRRSPRVSFHGAISESGGSFGPPRPNTMPGENLKRLARCREIGRSLRPKRGSLVHCRAAENRRRQAARPAAAAWACRGPSSTAT